MFTPKGEIKTMPQNSTALDFAFSLHTDIGSHCIGAKVNHKLVPLSHKLQSGDQVEVSDLQIATRAAGVGSYMPPLPVPVPRSPPSCAKKQKRYQKEGEAILARLSQERGYTHG